MDGKLRHMTSLYLVREGEILCLLRQGSKVANNKFVGACGGHFEECELNNARACIMREMEEELGLADADVEDVQLRYITCRLKNGEIRQNYYFFGSLSREMPLKSNEGILHWVPFADVPKLDMPVSAKHMILHYLNAGRFDHALYAGITEEKGTTFTVMREFEG